MTSSDESHASRGPSSKGLTVSLIRKAKQGSARAFSLLAERCHPRILRMVRRRLGPGMRGQLESGDVAQDVWVEALNAFERYEPRGEGSFDPYLRSVVENRIRNLNRRQQRRPMSWMGTDQLDDQEGSSEAQARQLEEEWAQLEAWVAELPADQREAWTLRYGEPSLTYRQIGARLGRSEAAVSMLLSRARTTLLQRGSAGDAR